MTESLRLLYEAPDLPRFALPADLEHRYGGPLGFAEPRLVANFVSSIDGVAAIPDVPGSVRIIGGQNPADRFVMALLRACADVLLIGAATFRSSREARWTAASMYPAAAADFAALRQGLARSGEPELAVVSGSGALDHRSPALEAGALVLTTDQGAERLRGRLPSASTVLALGSSLDAGAVVRALRQRGHRLILTEGGPTLHGALLGAGLVDELFLTVSPVLAGRSSPSMRPSVAEDVELLPTAPTRARILSARLEGDYLFLRYELTSS